MYIARIKKQKGTNYILRESREEGKEFHDLFDLGLSPAPWIRYPGRNAFYLDEAMVDAVMDLADSFDMDQLEDLFWPWVRPDIRQAVETFRNRSFSGQTRLSDQEKETLLRSTHAFDKRRAHYLKFGNMDQGPLENMPPVLFRNLIHKSRDEIEQNFMAQEARLRDREVKSYVYAIFDIQSFFSGFLAKKMPQAMDQNKVEAYFLKEICRLNRDLFGSGSDLDNYMIRYLIMFFDHEYAHTTLLEEMERNFRSRHRAFREPPKPSMQTRKACEVFGLDKTELKTLSKRDLTRRYRKLAGKAHPDRGGSNEAFIRLNTAFEALLAKIQ